MLFGKRRAKIKTPQAATARPSAAAVDAAREAEPVAERSETAARPETVAPVAAPPPFVPGETLPADEVGATLTIDRAAVVQNWRTLASRAAPADCAAVVKADAYGCGLEPIASALAAAGCNT